MSLEVLISGLTAALQANTAAMQAMTGAPAAAPQVQQVPPQTFNPATQQAPATPGAMPGAPFPGGGPAAPVAPPPAPTGLPFNDVASLVKYATDAYHALEAKQAGRGGWLQQVLGQMGFNSANEIPQTHYQAFHQQVENLKAQP